MPIQHEATTPAELASCGDCPACRKRRGEAIASGTLHSYSSEPRSGWVPRRAPDESSDSLVMGVELETQLAEGENDLPGRPVYADPYQPTAEERAAEAAWSRRNREHHYAIRRQRLTVDEAVAVASPRGMWHPKHDGSVSGPEFASQPCSLEVWRTQRHYVATMMRSLIHGGVRSHDGAYSCSMHVNLNTSVFRSDAGWMARFFRLVTMNPRFTTKWCQRTNSQIRSWARFDAYPDMAACERYADRLVRDGYVYTSHGDVLNLSHSGRIEFRAPRGTLRVDRFFAKLEVVAGMVEFTQNPACSLNPSGFIDWLMTHRDRFPEASRFMAELFPARVE